MFEDSEIIEHTKDDFNPFIPATIKVFSFVDPVARLIKEDIRSVSSQSERAFNGIHCFSIYMTLTASRVRSLKSVRQKFPHEGRT